MDLMWLFTVPVLKLAIKIAILLAALFLSILNSPDGPPHTSFVYDALNVMNSIGSNFYELLINQSATKLPVIHDDIQEDVRITLQDCLQNWNIGAKRKEFKTIMEEYVPARLD